jgi:hypothetical protein
VFVAERTHADDTTVPVPQCSLLNFASDPFYIVLAVFGMTPVAPTGIPRPRGRRQSKLGWSFQTPHLYFLELCLPKAASTSFFLIRAAGGYRAH